MGKLISKRLKLYDTTIKVCINHKNKEKLRKIAFCKKMTLSEYIRYLITLDLKIRDVLKLSNKQNLSLNDINNILNNLRRENK